MVLKYAIKRQLALYLRIISSWLLHCDVGLYLAVQLCFIRRVRICVTASWFTLSCWHSCWTSVVRIKVNPHSPRIQMYSQWRS